MLDIKLKNGVSLKNVSDTQLVHYRPEQIQSVYDPSLVRYLTLDETDDLRSYLLDMAEERWEMADSGDDYSLDPAELCMLHIEDIGETI
jgi:hypothetical protein